MFNVSMQMSANQKTSVKFVYNMQYVCRLASMILAVKVKWAKGKGNQVSNPHSPFHCSSQNQVTIGVRNLI